MLVDLKQTNLMFEIMGCWIIDCYIVESTDLKTNKSRFWKFQSKFLI
jgi:hypothetical protein